MGSLRADGYTLGFISHRLDEVLAISDRVTVLRDGAKVLSAPRSEIDRAGLVKAMVRARADHEGRGARLMSTLRAARRCWRVEDLTSLPHFGRCEL